MKRKQRSCRSIETPQGNFVQVWLSPEFLAYAKKHGVDPALLASSCCHTLGRKSPGLLQLVERVETTPQRVVQINRISHLL